MNRVKFGNLHFSLIQSLDTRVSCWVDWEDILLG